jgi:IS605 OrfB family transposase
MSNRRSHSQPGAVYRQRVLRLDPNRVQASALARACGTRRWAYNWALEQQKQAYAATGRFLGPAEQMPRAHARVSRQRSDYLHKISSQLARSKQAVVIEDLAVGGMLKSRRFSRGLADQALASLRRQLQYKCPASGCRLLVAPRYFPSSKRCSDSGWIWVGMPLTRRPLVEIGAQLRRPALVS